MSDPKGMTAERLEEIRRAADAATPGPWEAHGDSRERPPMVWDASGDSIVNRMPDDGGTPYFEPEDAAFIAVAREAVPELVKEVERLARKSRADCHEVARLRKALEEIADGDGRCKSSYGGCDGRCQNYAHATLLE